ncbi:MAG: hypothetical protein HBSAPP03_26320 [Phycisphaerae bacterium]|nr:MAG: hypothetical protein HBSAPP03_26320 [Phycisphaerae bacterium]
MRFAAILTAVLLAGCTATPVSPGLMQPRQPWPNPPQPAAPPEVTPELIKEALATGVQRLLALQEGPDKAEWPYEGVYRVNRQIPMGYRIGGTAIVVQALAHAPGYDNDQPRKDAIDRAVAFICTARADPTMSIDDYTGGYDVRGWGYIEAVQVLCRLKALGRMPEARAKDADEALAWYLDALQRHEIPVVGGWNYARGPVNEKANPSPFMTVRALEALFDAKSLGLVVKEDVIARALTVLDKARGATGTVIYAGAADGRALRRSDAVPGAVGRMASAEAVLMSAGKGRERDCRAAVEAFLVNWPWLEQRRAKTGTHEGPYAIAPYYFMFAHLYAARAVEHLDPSDRAEYRRRVREAVFLTRTEDGTWNDRVFPRSAGYGTAMAMLALMQNDIKPALWSSPGP